MPESLGTEPGKAEGGKPGQEPRAEGPTLLLLLVWMSFSGGCLTSTTWSRRPSGSSEYQSACPGRAPVYAGAPERPRQVDTCVLHLLTQVEMNACKDSR